MNEIQFKLSISSEDYLRYYQGAAGQVITRSVDGQSLQFPANLLRPFVTHTGIQGLFAIQFDDQHKCQGIRRIFPS